MRNHLPKLLGLSGLAMVLSGCGVVRFKGVESFHSATTPVQYTSKLPDEQKAWKGDKYGFGGVANGSGGLKAQTSYGAGSNPDSTEPVDPHYDQPAKGTGQQPGEFNGQPAGGYGQTNSPLNQPAASDAHSLSARSGS